MIKGDGNTEHMDNVKEQRELFPPHACFNRHPIKYIFLTGVRVWR